MDHEEDLTNFDDWLRRLKVEYDIFFNGHRKRPPEDLKMRVDKLVKRLGEATNMSFQERFRYNTLVARYYVYRDRWRRSLLEMEMGRDGGSRGAAPVGVPATPSKAPAARGLRISITDALADEQKVRQLYAALLAMKGGQAPISYKQFTKYIAGRVQTIREKHSCSSVLFTLAGQNDDIKFTAKAQRKG